MHSVIHAAVAGNGKLADRQFDLIVSGQYDLAFAHSLGVRPTGDQLEFCAPDFA